MQCPNGRIRSDEQSPYSKNGEIGGYWCTQGTQTRSWEKCSRTSTMRKWMPWMTQDQLIWNPENYDPKDFRTDRPCKEFNIKDYPTLNPLFEPLPEDELMNTVLNAYTLEKNYQLSINNGGVRT